MKKVLFTLATLFAFGFTASAGCPQLAFSCPEEITLNPGESQEIHVVLTSIDEIVEGFQLQFQVRDAAGERMPSQGLEGSMVYLAKIYGSRVKTYGAAEGPASAAVNEGNALGITAPLESADGSVGVYRFVGTNTQTNVFWYDDEETPANVWKMTIEAAAEWNEEFATFDMDQNFTIFQTASGPVHPDYVMHITVKNGAYEAPVVPLPGTVEFGEITEDGMLPIAYNGTEDVTITVTVNGEPVDYVNGMIQLPEGTSTVVVTVTAEGYEPLTATYEATYVPTPVPTPAPVINVTPGDDAYIFEAVGEGTVTLYVNGEEVTNPYTINRTTEDQNITVKAVAHVEGQTDGVVTGTYIIPALEIVPPTPVDLTGEIVIGEVTEDGKVQITYNGTEEGVTITVEGYELDDEGYIQLPDYGTYTITVTVGGEGYNDLVMTADVEWVQPTPPTPVTPTPEITYVVNDDAVVVTATGEGTVILYIDGVEVTNPCTINRAENDFVVVATATAQGEDMLISEEARMEITIPGTGVPVVEPGYFIVLIDQYGQEHKYELTQGENGEYTNTFTLEYDPWGSFPWNPNLTDEENELNRPNVPFYFLIDGVRYGADQEMRETVLGYALQNPLGEGLEDYYCVPVGFSYTLGVSVDNGNYYVYAAQSKRTGVDEMNAGKDIANIRYFNMAGQEMQKADGMTIVVTTYTDGTTSAVKVMK